MARQGVPYHHALHLRVVDEEMNDVAADGETLGEVVMRGNNVMKGYYGDPEATAEAIDSDGWLHSGDLGTMDAEGYVRITGRLKEMIIRGGENIYPAEIEQVISRSPAVSEVVVVRQADPKWGEVPVAFVVPMEVGLTEEQVLATCDGELARYKRPKQVLFLKEADLPRSTTGKIQRHELEKRL